MKTLFILLTLLTLSTQSSADSKSVAQIIESHLPKNMSSLKDDSGKDLNFKNQGLEYSYINANFDASKNKNYLVVLYKAWIGVTDIYCKLSVILLENNKSKMLGATVLNADGDILNCYDVSLKNLDGDENSEIIVSLADARGHDLPPAIFKWNKDHLIEITPSMVLDGTTVTAFRSLSITDYHIGKSTILLDKPDSSMGDDPTYKTYLMQNGKINLTGSYDYFKFIEKKPGKPAAVTVLTPAFAAEGSYTLDIKNISSHNHAVRAEITINGSVVLKPSDFCQAPPPKNKNNDHDDDDDRDEDHNKRCVQKQDVYVNVNMKKTNDIKVKVYGPGASVLQFSLSKK